MISLKRVICNQLNYYKTIKKNLTTDERKKFIEFYKSLSEESKIALDRIIRVDHAGEFGADRIYAGQMAVLGRTSIGPTIQVIINNNIK